MTKTRNPKPQPAGTASDAGSASDADALAFRAAVGDVRPLRVSPKVAPPPRPPARKRRAPARASIDAEIDLPAPLLAADVAPDETLSFHRAGVREQVLRRLRRGLMPIEAELDLHGYNQARARELLAEFLRLARARGNRCLRIIHGKGMRSGGRGAVLKSAVNTWLRHHYDVLAFTSAKGIDGGTGAVYVLLRA